MSGATDRGVSDTVAFTLVFAIIITSVGVTGIYGVEAVETMRDSAQANTAEASMQGFAMGIEAIRNDRVPRRTVQLKLEGDELATRSSTLRIEIGYADGTVENESIPIGSLVRHSTRDTTFVYASGAIFRQQRRGAVVLDPPAIRCGGDTGFASLVALEGSVGVTSDGSVTLTQSALDRRTVAPNTSGGARNAVRNLTIDTSGTQRPALWDRLFATEYAGWTEHGGRYTCSGIGAAFVRVTRVKIERVR